MISAVMLLGIACLGALVVVGIVVAVVAVYQWPRSHDDKHS